MDEKPTFGEWVRRYRRIRKLTQQQLAEKVGTDKAGMNLIEGDKREPGHDLAQRIIKALEAPTEPFLRALGYPVGEERPDWESGLLADDRLDTSAKDALLRILRPLLAESDDEQEGKQAV